DELDQLGGVAELARGREARGQVAAQRDDVADAVRPVALELRRDLLARGGDVGDVRRRLVAGAAHLEDRLERAFARRAAGAEGHREERGLQRCELAPGLAQLVLARRSLRREELEAKGSASHRDTV